jgi:hypothetical protein
MSDINPNILAEYEYESQFMQSQQKGNRRVKIERGQMWTLRFLPAKLGPKGQWFARIARHWLSKSPIICPKYTSPDFGGDPDAYCPCCEVAANLNESPDEAISKFGYSAQGNPMWLTFCIVFDKNGAQQNTNDLLVPYEFNHYKSTFEELFAFFKAGTRRSPLSIFDYKSGNDFVVTKTGKGLKFDKQDAAPIFDLADPNYKAYIAKIEAGIKMPKIQMPTDDQLHAFSLKISEWADKLAAGQNPGDAPRGGRRRPAPESEADLDAHGGGDGGYQESDEPQAPPPRRPAPAAAAAPARRPAPAPAPEPEQQAESPMEDNPELAPAPRKPAAAAPAAPARRPAPAAAPAAAPRRAPAPAPVEAAEPEAAEPEPELEAEAPAAAPARPAAAPARRPAPAAQPLVPSPNRARAASAEAKASVPEEQGAEEEDALPEEAVDQAPPAETAVGEPEVEAPPAVTRKGGAGLGAAIRGKIAGLSRQGA